MDQLIYNGVCLGLIMMTISSACCAILAIRCAELPLEPQRKYEQSLKGLSHLISQDSICSFSDLLKSSVAAFCKLQLQKNFLTNVPCKH